ncbi:hypothetical protein [Chondromyces crocatus]|uniref:DNA/RNA non-specific endonuclease domain-containing protein n=1 Tax=Chondromyces crocatus TaxID=52 RepID=A0A0K1ESR1_CHOCO|nr:hypothetical protein [Chondromyces crocatus]AKT43906.1 uncharacterized protein CMC5_081430 [Chondromyces crocatus]
MSRVSYNGRWQVDALLFTTVNLNNGPLSQRYGVSMGGTWGYALLGPDLAMPGGSSPGNGPTAVGPGWNQPWPPDPRGRPNETFVQDLNQKWIRGHLVNGEWNGSGANWSNLTPLTSTANSNHKTVEQFVKNYLTASHQYENGGYRDDWYGLEYLAECAVAPWSHPTSTNQTNLYSYATEFVRVTVRAVSIKKPTNLQNPMVPPFLASLPRTSLNSVTRLPFTVAVPPVMVGATCLPSAGNTPGGTVSNAGIPLTLTPANGFDRRIEIHQS